MGVFQSNFSLDYKSADFTVIFISTLDTLTHTYHPKHWTNFEPQASTIQIMSSFFEVQRPLEKNAEVNVWF